VVKKISPLHKNNAVNLKINKIMTTQRLYSFLVVFLLMFLGTGFGQSQTGPLIAPKPSDTARYDKFTSSEYRSFTTQNSPVKKTLPLPKNFSLNIVPATFYASQLGIICRTELQLDKLTPVPIRFRLGSLAYVNYLEKKPNAINPQR